MIEHPEAPASHPRRRSLRRLLPTAIAVAAAALIVPTAASALTVTKAELHNGQLRIEGSNAVRGTVVSATSSTSVGSARADGNGNFKIEASNFSSPDCTVIVTDTSTQIATPTLSGCTPTAPPPVGQNPPPSGSCVIDTPAPATFHVGELANYFFTTTGCGGGTLRWSIAAGATPPGMGQPIPQGQTAGELSGVPTTAGTYTFTLKVTDGAGNTDQKNVTLTILAANPLSVASAPTLPGGTVNQGYEVFLKASGGLPGFAWSVVAGALPRGLAIQNELGTIGGIPTQSGTFHFTLRVTDSAGAHADQAMTLVIAPSQTAGGRR
jgi:Putative Ig domain